MFSEKLITRPWRILLPLVAIRPVATACSSTRLGYDATPTWLGWRLDRYLGLGAGQREMASASIDALHRWHRQTQLPAYSAFLGPVRARLDAPIAPGEIGRWREEALAAPTPPAERIAGLWRSADPARREAIARSTAAADALSATVLARPGQRRPLHRRLRDFAGDFSVLAVR